jgi:glycosyltransferase involved in cell wall biosynthesis
MKIALFHNLHPGGAKRALYEHARGLRDRGHSLDSYTLSTAADHYLPLDEVCNEIHRYDLDSAEADEIPVFDRLLAQRKVQRFLPDNLRTWAAAYVEMQRLHREQDRLEQLFVRMAKDIDGRGYDLVYVHQCHLSLSPALLRLLKTPTLYYAQDTLRYAQEWSLAERPGYDSCHDTFFLRQMLGQTYALPSVGLLRRKERQHVASARAASLVLVNSWYSREAFVRSTGINPHVCYLGADAEFFCPDPAVSREPVVLSVGALSPNKRHDFIIEALGTLPAERRPRMRIIGYELESGTKTHGPTALQLLALAERHNVELQIDKDVSDEELREAYRVAAVVAFAPVLEPFGFTPLEAMACATPVVGVSEGGLRETIQNGLTGFQTSRVPEDFGDAIDRLVTDKRLAARFGTAGRKCVLKHWTWKKSVDELENWIARAVATGEDSAGRAANIARVNNFRSVTRFQVCTILARNYLAHARVLHRSLRQFHPDCSFSALVFDAPSGSVREEFEAFGLEDIGLPPGEEIRMPMLYNVTELATALKPWFFRQLLSRQKADVLYFDPDIEIFSPLDHLAELAREHSLVVTPHTTRPMRRDSVKPNETDILAAGTYNLGFLGLNSEADKFLDWWGERLLREAVIDPANMRFTDQRWMDFAPGYFDTWILKDETCNVAYWNADARPLTWTGKGYVVRDEPLSFFHFSGFNPATPYLLSSYQGGNPRTRLSQHPDLQRLCHEYAGKLLASDYAEQSKIPYGYDTAPQGLQITTPMRLAYREALRQHEQTGTTVPPNPFSAQAEFIAWLNEPLHPTFCPEITRYFWAIHAARPDLQSAFPDLLGIGAAAAYYEWLLSTGRPELEIPDALFPQRVTPAVSVRLNRRLPNPGINLASDQRTPAGRLLLAAVKESGEEHATLLLSDSPKWQNHSRDSEGETAAVPSDTNLICINADQLPRVARRLERDFFDHCYNIGFWSWEAEVFPPSMLGAFNFVEEVWVPSEFVRLAIAKVSPVPVSKIPFPLKVDARTPAAPARSELRLPETCLFLFCFDFSSVFQRQNPVGLIEAFKQAFARGEGPVLVIRSSNGDRHLSELEQLYYVRGDRSDIIIRDDPLSEGEKRGLMATSDCFISLHRSTGFGLDLAEAMLMEKPVIATRYGGNLEFMNDANSFLCRHELRLIGNEAAPYPPQARWAEPDIAEAARLMRQVRENPQEARRRGAQGRLDLCAGHDPRNAGTFIKNRLAELRRKPPAILPLSARHTGKADGEEMRTAIEQGRNVRAGAIASH